MRKRTCLIRRGKNPWKKRGGLPLLFLAALLLTNGCGRRQGALPEETQPSSGGVFPISAPVSAADAPENPADSPLLGSSLLELGYTMEERQDIGVLYPVDVAHPVDGRPQPAGYGVQSMGRLDLYGGPPGTDVLKGTFTRVVAWIPWVPFMNGPVSKNLMYLQGFRKEELAREGARVKAGERTYQARELAQYLVFQDEDILVFDLFPPAFQTTFSKSLGPFVRDMCAYGARQPFAEPPPLSPDKDYPDYTYMQEVYDYVRENLPQLVHKETAPAPPSPLD